MRTRKPLPTFESSQTINEDSFESDLLRMSVGLRIFRRENPQVYDILNKKFDLDKLSKQVEEIKKFSDDWDRMTGGEKVELAKKLGVKYTLESMNESVSSVDDMLNSFVSDPTRYRIEIGSGTMGNNKPDKEWMISKIDEFIHTYFHNDEYHYTLSDADQDKYNKKLEQFKKDSVKNFKKFYDQWMDMKEDKWNSTYQLKSGMYDKAQELIKV